MSRFEDTLRRDLEQIADRATPSPDAWAQIQSRIADQEPIQETEIIMLTENTLTRRRWPLVVGAAAAVVALVIALAAVNRDTEPEIPADNPDPTPTVPTGRDGESATDIDALTAEADELPPVEPEVSPLPAEGEALPAGSYAPFTLGLPVTFDVPEATATPWTVQVSNPVTINIGNADGFVVLTRMGSLYDAEQSQGPMTGLGSIPPNDLDGWIEANDVIVLDQRDDTIDGRSASYRQVTAPAGDGTEQCPADLNPCVSLASASADLQDVFDGVAINVFGENPHSVWFVELDDFEPLAIWTAAVGADPDAWIAEITPLIESITLGDPAPATEFGQARLSTFDPGIPVEITETGTFEGARTPGEPLADGSFPVTSTFSVAGAVAGEMTGEGTATAAEAGVNEAGADVFTFTGTIDGVGTGTVTYAFDWQLVNGVYTSTGLITGGTGDFAGATGTTATSIREVGQEGEIATSSGTITFFLQLP